MQGPDDTLIPALDLANDFTVAVWIKVDTRGDDVIWSIKQNNDNRVGLVIGDNGEIGQMHYDNRDGQSDYTRQLAATGTISPNTWYRVVCVWIGVGTTTSGTSTVSNMSFYINGVAPTVTDSNIWGGGSELGSALDSLLIGAQGSPKVAFFAGKMSDFQVWDGAWTQSDVTHDYLNPESLVLNNEGTSLTESNLKIWYPMQDGHRG